MASPMETEKLSNDMSHSLGHDEDTASELSRYLGYTCDYHACKYKDEGITWGELFQKDMAHFIDLMSHHVGASTKTFNVLSQLLSPEKREAAKRSTRRVDTPEYKKEQEDFYLNLTCTYKGKSNGKTWREIKDTNYSFFVWAVGNAMGRDTKSFHVFKRCLKPEDQKMVEETAKGEVRSKRRKTFHPIRTTNDKAITVH